MILWPMPQVLLCSTAASTISRLHRSCSR